MSIDWSRYDERARTLEAALRDVLSKEPRAGDDRRLARVYAALARLLRPMMDDVIGQYMDLLQGPKRDSMDAASLKELSERLGGLAWAAQSKQMEDVLATESAFYYRLLESCARPRFTIYPDTDVEPIGWAAAAGVPLEAIEKAVFLEYPELRHQM